MLHSLSQWSAAQYHHLKMLGVVDGLSNATVVDIAQDKTGAMWFATEEGVNRFDGNRFFTYRKTDGLAANELNCLLDDPTDSALWIGPQREGRTRLDYTDGSIRTFRHDNASDSLSANSITDISPSSDGSIWIATYWGGVNKYIRETGTFRRYYKNTVPQLPSNQTWTVTESSDGMLYIGHVYDGLSVLDLHTDSVRNYLPNSANPFALPSQQVFCIFVDSKDNIWVGTSAGLVLFDSQSDKFHRCFESNPLLAGEIHSIRQMDEDHLLVATSQSRVCVIDLSQDMHRPESVTVESISVNGGDMANSNITINSILQDSNRNIWIGTRLGGIGFMAHRTPLFANYSHSPYPTNEYALNSNNVSSITTAPDSTLWIGTLGGGFNIFRDSQRIAIYNKNKGTLPSDNILSTHYASDGTLWVGVKNEGLYYITSDGKVAQLIWNSEVRTLHEDSDGYLWVGTSQGVYQINKDSRTVERRLECPVNFVWSLRTAADGTLWVGTFGGGLFRYDADFNLLSRMYDENGFPSNTLNHLHFSPIDSTLWAATGEGLVRLAPPYSTPEVFGLSDGLHNACIQAVTEDSEGNIWFSTNQGLGCYVPHLDTIFNYHSTVGIPQTNFNPGSVGTSADGTLWFGSSYGLCFFRPEQVLSAGVSPRVVITELCIPQPLDGDTFMELEEHVRPQGNLTFSHTQNTFDIFFTVDDYALADQVEYAYRIVGLNDSWYSNGNRRRVNFSNLSPGDYTFEVRARMHGAKWNGEVTSLSLTVNPSPWLTPWMKTLYFCIFIAIITTFVLFRRHRKRLEREIRCRAREIRRLNRITENLKKEATTFREQADAFRKQMLTFKKTKDEQLTQAISDQDTAFLMQLTEIIEREIASEKLDVAWLSQQMGMSESTLYRKVKSLTGSSTNEFVRGVRIRRAEKLIISGKYSVSEIGYMVGYGSPTNFRRAFKEEFELTPTAYVNALKERD